MKLFIVGNWKCIEGKGLVCSLKHMQSEQISYPGTGESAPCFSGFLNLQGKAFLP